ncbi:MAG: beta-galactosidase [Polyangiaceae bacterium]
MAKSPSVPPKRTLPPKRTSSGVKRIRSPRQGSSSAPPPSGLRVRVHPHGLDLSDVGALAPDVLPLVAGAMHYWRHPPSAWAPGLDAIRGMGFRILDTYVPWGIHEMADGTFDFGERDPRLDVVDFVKLAAERDLKVIIRPGPHINAELTYFGLPERVVWDRACQARTPRGNPVMLPMVPVAFPVPSYASQVFHEEAAKWLMAVGDLLAPYRHPEGPIVLVQVDNEGALYFRDGPYDQDYHPDAVSQYRAFLARRYVDDATLRGVYGDPSLSLETVDPPVRFDATTLDALPRHMDWMEFHEHLLGDAMWKMARVVAKSGLGELPTSHNMPPGDAATPLNASRVGESVDLVGTDYYHRATKGDHASIERRTCELVVRSEGRGVPAFAAEMGAGFAPFFVPIDAIDSLYTVMTTLAYGLRGYNLYMAVERDRWIGAPIDPHGKRREHAAWYENLNRALESTRFHTLKRRTPVRLVIPRALRRLARATHAFGPATPALFNILGAGFRESCLDEDFGTGEVWTALGESYLRAFERALRARGVPFSYAGGESLAEGTVGAEWIVCATIGGLKADFVEQLRSASRRMKVTIGPKAPERDGSMRALSAPYDLSGLHLEALDDMSAADALVARSIEELGLPTYPVTSEDVFVTVHEDASGTPRVAFVMNPTDERLLSQVSIPGANRLVDTLRDRTIDKVAGAFEVSLRPRTVRMFSVES